MYHSSDFPDWPADVKKTGCPHNRGQAQVDVAVIGLVRSGVNPLLFRVRLYGRGVADSGAKAPWQQTDQNLETDYMREYDPTQEDCYHLQDLHVDSQDLTVQWHAGSPRPDHNGTNGMDICQYSFQECKNLVRRCDA